MPGPLSVGAAAGALLPKSDADSVEQPTAAVAPMPSASAANIIFNARGALRDNKRGRLHKLVGFIKGYAREAYDDHRFTLRACRGERGPTGQRMVKASESGALQITTDRSGMTRLSRWAIPRCGGFSPRFDVARDGVASDIEGSHDHDV